MFAYHNVVNVQSMRLQSPAVRSSIIILIGMSGFVFGWIQLLDIDSKYRIPQIVCLWTSVILIAVGMIAMNRMERSVKYHRDAILARNCFTGFLIPFLAIAGWPVLFFTAELAGAGTMLLLLLLFWILAWDQSRFVAKNLCLLICWRRVRLARLLIYIGQSVLIWGSLPIFIWFVNRMEGQGIHIIGWE